MLRILIAAAVLLVAAYFYINQGDGEDARPLEAQQQALDKAKAVEQQVQEDAKKLQEEIEKQTGDDPR